MAYRFPSGPSFLRLLLLAFMAFAAASPSRAETACCSGADCAAAYSGNRVALVVGVNEYAVGHTGVKPLLNAVNDAKTIGAILKDQGFSVLCLENASKMQLTRALRNMGQYMRRHQDEVGPIPSLVSVIFFAGHGFAAPSNDFLLLAPEPCENGATCERPPRDNLTLDMLDLDGIIGSYGANAFSRFVIVDACRTELENGIGGIAGSGSGHFGRYSRLPSGSKAVFFVSTRDGEVAVDYNDRLGALSNGLFVSRLKAILAFDRIGLDDVAHATIAAFALLDDPTVRQRPTPPQSQPFIANSRLRAKAGQDDTCSLAFDRNVVNFSQCQEEHNNCRQLFCNLAHRFCNGTNCMSPAEQACLRPLLASIRPDHADLCRNYPLTEEQFARVQPEVPFNTIASAQLESFSRASRQTAAQNRELASIATAGRPLQKSAQVRDKLLRLPPTPTRAPVDLVVDSSRIIRIRALPNAASDIVRITAPGERLVADCFSQQCPPGWMGVQLHSQGKIYRGWISFDDAAAVANVSSADEVFRFGFSDGTSRPDEDDLLRIINRIREIGPGRNLAASILVTQSGGAFEDAAHADARVVRIRRALVQSGVPFQNIAPAIMVTPVTSRPTGTVRLSVR